MRLSRCLRGFSTDRTQRFRRLLEISETAGETEIKAAYLRLVKEYHPDSTSLQDKKRAAEIFQQLTEARDSLLTELSTPNTVKPNLWEKYSQVKAAKTRPAPKEDKTKSNLRQEYNQELKKTLLLVAVAICIWMYLSIRHSFIWKPIIEIDMKFQLQTEDGVVVMKLEEQGRHGEYQQLSAHKDIWRCRECSAVLQRMYIPQHFKLNN